MKTFSKLVLAVSLAAAVSSYADQKTLIDYFQPMPIRSALTTNAWGATNVLPRDPQNGLEDATMKNWCYWDGSILKAADGKYHLFASRWDQAKGHNGWGSSCAVQAVSDNPVGPYVEKGLLWPTNQNGKGHNVTALVLPDGRYAVVVSETRPGTVFVSQSLDGPWEQLGTIRVNIEKWRASNEIIIVRPDGQFEMFGRAGRILISTNGILGPYEPQGGNIYRDIAGLPKRNLEDPVLWFSGGLYHITVNCWSERKAFHLTSPDGITNWTNRGLAYNPDADFLRYTDGTVNHWNKIERPGVLLENGHVAYFTFAVLDVPKDQERGNDTHGSKVIVVPFDGAALDRDLQPPADTNAAPAATRDHAYGISGPGAKHNAKWTNYNSQCTGAAVKAGLIPNLKPLIPDTQVRDTDVILGGDGNYYLTGSTGADIWDFNSGVELWRSPDLKKWDYVGLVWSLAKDATWEKEPRELHGKPTVTIWAPEIRFLKKLNTYAIVLSMAPGGISILKSTTGKPEGPYVNPVPGGKPLRGGIDATLFEDDDGKVYFVNGAGGTISLMKDDLTGFAETRKVELLHPDLNPAHHAAKVVQRGMKGFGHEGAVLFKANGKYYHGAVDDYEGRYSSCVAIATNIWGPYDQWHEAVPCGGGTDYFQDKAGNWWCAFFGNDNAAPFREKPAIVKIDFATDGKIFVADEQPSFVLQAGAKTHWRETGSSGGKQP